MDEIHKHYPHSTFKELQYSLVKYKDCLRKHEAFIFLVLLKLECRHVALNIFDVIDQNAKLLS